MGPVSITLALLMKHPTEVATAAQKLITPPTVDVAQMRESFADLTTGILKCHHKTAHYQLSDVMQQPG